MIRKNYLIRIKDQHGDDFRSRLLRFMFLSVSFASLLSMTVNVVVVGAEQLTGCVKKNGKLIELALGSDPLEPCKAKETEVSLVLDANGGGPTQRVVISGTVDLNADGDIVVERFDSLGRRSLDHFKEILVPDLSLDDLPAMTLYRRVRTDLGRTPVPFPSAFQPYDTNNLESRDDRTDVTKLFFDNGRILLRFKTERFNLDGTLRFVQFGLDGPGGTGDLRLILIR